MTIIAIILVILTPIVCCFFMLAYTAIVVGYHLASCHLWQHVSWALPQCLGVVCLRTMVGETIFILIGLMGAAASAMDEYLQLQIIQ